MTEPRENVRPDKTDQAETAAGAPAGEPREPAREADATIRSIRRLEESN